MLTDDELREKYTNYEPCEATLAPYSACKNKGTIGDRSEDIKAPGFLRQIILGIVHHIQLLSQLHRVASFRRRYFYTRDNRVRLRYIVATFLLLSISSSVVLMQLSKAQTPFAGSFSLDKVTGLFDRDDIELTNEDGEAVPASVARSSGSLQEAISSGIAQAAAALTQPKFETERSLTLKSGQTLAGVLQKEGVSGAQAYQAVKALGKHYDPRKVRPGQKISLVVQKDKTAETPEITQNDVANPTPEKIILDQMVMILDPIKSIEVSRSAETDTFNSEIVKKDVSLQKNVGAATIQTSVYGSAAKAGIPSAITAEMIRIYSWDVDFQRDIRQGDKIEVLYEAYQTKGGDVARYGNVLYAKITVAGVSIPVYRFKMRNGDIDYFTEDGWSIKKALMKTPIDGARLSSGFGMRKHPVLGYNKMHKGVDFAAPTGTPIYAAGDGTIDFKGRKGGYGNYIRIRHNSQLKTAYAHMHRFAKGMGTGKRVKQGQVIGYVGTTGRSTGPHLHYEVLKNNKQVNPNRVDLPTGEKLKGANMTAFKARMKELNKQYKEVAQSTKIVQNQSKQKTSIQ